MHRSLIFLNPQNSLSIPQGQVNRIYRMQVGEAPQTRAAQRTGRVEWAFQQWRAPAATCCKTGALFPEHKGISFSSDCKQPERKQSSTDAHLLEGNIEKTDYLVSRPPSATGGFHLSPAEWLFHSQPPLLSPRQEGEIFSFFLSSFLLSSLLPHPPLSCTYSGKQ